MPEYQRMKKRRKELYYLLSHFGWALSYSENRLCTALCEVRTIKFTEAPEQLRLQFW